MSPSYVDKINAAITAEVERRTKLELDSFQAMERIERLCRASRSPLADKAAFLNGIIEEIQTWRNAQ